MSPSVGPPGRTLTRRPTNVESRPRKDRVRAPSPTRSGVSAPATSGLDSKVKLGRSAVGMATGNSHRAPVSWERIFYVDYPVPGIRRSGRVDSIRSPASSSGLCAAESVPCGSLRKAAAIVFTARLPSSTTAPRPLASRVTALWILRSRTPSWVSCRSKSQPLSHLRPVCCPRAEAPVRALRSAELRGDL